MYLVDTNVLLRFSIREHPLNATVRAALRKLLTDRHELKITPQNCIEFGNVATRPLARNGFGLPLAETQRSLRRIERLFSLLLDQPETYSEWRELVVKFGVSGIQVHDARLVAVMNVNRITHILTFNTTDFRRYGRRDCCDRSISSVSDRRFHQPLLSCRSIAA
jgi:predicted nucleic acid-binding protein